MAAITLKEKVNFILPGLDERLARKYLAVESLSLGHGGVKEVSDASGVSRSTIHTGIRELANPPGDIASGPALKSKGPESQAAGGSRSWRPRKAFWKYWRAW